RQVLINLVGNAVKFTERGEVVVHVARDGQTGDRVRLHFSVADTGVGIPLDKQKSIFNAFEQADSSTTRQYGGTGLGLAIAARLAQMMDGKIWVESEPGRGSVFHFTACLSLAKEPVEPAVADVGSLKDLAVLVVDDNATNRQILQEVLSNWQMR